MTIYLTYMMNYITYSTINHADRINACPPISCKHVQFILLNLYPILKYGFVKYVPHADIIKWKHIPRYWSFVRGIHRHRWISAQRPVTRSFDIFLIFTWFNGWVNNREDGDLRRHSAHYDVILMQRSINIQSVLVQLVALLRSIHASPFLGY